MKCGLKECFNAKDAKNIWGNNMIKKFTFSDLILTIIITAFLTSLVTAAIISSDLQRTNTKLQDVLKDYDILIERIERLETRISGHSAAHDYFHQELEKLKGE